MSDTYLRVLGKPELILKGERIDRLRTWRLWGVLAYVALSPTPVPRAVLAATFWPEVDNPRANLKVALNDLRQRAGQEIFREHNECLSLIPGFHSDVQELRRYTGRAKQVTSSAHKHCYLDAAATLARDEFLIGCSGDWVIQRRGELFLECRALLRELLELKLELGEPGECLTTARELLRYDPENALATALLLQFDNPDTVKELATARQLIQSRLHRWNKPGRAMLYGLATFPGTFRADQAREITGLTYPELCHASATGLLQESGPQEFVLPETVRQDFWRRLTGGERRRFRRRLAGWFLRDLLERSPLAQSYPALLSAEPRKPGNDLSAYLQKEKDNLIATLNICTEETEVEGALLFLCVFWEVAPELRPTIGRYYEIIERGVPDKLPDALQHYVYATLAMMSIGDSRLEPFFYEFLRRYSLDATEGHWERAARYRSRADLLPPQRRRCPLR
ncbi:MAG: hypothetical protein QM758_06325 [Armatimonas sp.]